MSGHVNEILYQITGPTSLFLNIKYKNEFHNYIYLPNNIYPTQMAHVVLTTGLLFLCIKQIKNIKLVFK